MKNERKRGDYASEHGSENELSKWGNVIQQWTVWTCYDGRKVKMNKKKQNKVVSWHIVMATFCKLSSSFPKGTCEWVRIGGS